VEPPCLGPSRSAGPNASRPALLLLLTLTLTSSLGQIASTIYVPSLPAIAAGLDTTGARVQFTFVGYLLAFAISMLVVGPVSDRYRRRRVMIFGVALSTLGSIAAGLSLTVELLIAARILQGVGLSEPQGHRRARPPIRSCAGHCRRAGEGERGSRRVDLDAASGSGFGAPLPRSSCATGIVINHKSSP